MMRFISMAFIGSIIAATTMAVLIIALPAVVLGLITLRYYLRRKAREAGGSHAVIDAHYSVIHEE
jgi:hypothetical protein